MANDPKTEKEIQEMLRSAAQHAWDHPKDNFARRREFENAGIKSEFALKQAMERAIKEEGARSFDRAPSLGQSKDSMVFDTKIVDAQKREHHITVILNPERDEQGKLKNSTVYINDSNERSGFSRSLEREYQAGNDPKVLLRGADLSRPEQQAVKSPYSRLDRKLGPLEKPTLEPEKPVTPKQEAQHRTQEGVRQMNREQLPPRPRPRLQLRDKDRGFER